MNERLGVSHRVPVTGPVNGLVSALVPVASPKRRTFVGVSSARIGWKLLTPKWLLLHLCTVAACCAMIWLGHWQWTAARRHHGEIRNYAYALQWWAFTGFAGLMWCRVIRDYRRPDEPVLEAPVRSAAPRYLAYRAPIPLPDDDPERTRFNAYLASLRDRDAYLADLPARNEPARNEPARNAPARNAPARNVPARNVPARNVPARNETDLP